MLTLGTHTHHEIQSQPEAWQAALEVLHDQATEVGDFYHLEQFESVLFTGCGSTYYLALAAAALFQELVETPARGLPASEIWLYPASAYLKQQRTLLVAISRSGETTETLRACEAFRKNAKGEILTLSCYPGRPLAQIGALNLAFPSGQEQSVAQTRAFSTLYLATTALASIWSGRRDLFDRLANLPKICRRLLSDHATLTTQVGGDLALERFYFLGSGPRYGLACELSLKMKEMTLSHSEPFHFLEFRHGPQSMVNPHTLLVGLVSQTNRAHEIAVLGEMRQRGAQALSLGEVDCDISFDSGIPESSWNILYLPVVQMLAFERARSKNLDPDHPHNLDAVVRLE